MMLYVWHSWRGEIESRLVLHRLALSAARRLRTSRPPPHPQPVVYYVRRTVCRGLGSDIYRREVLLNIAERGGAGPASSVRPTVVHTHNILLLYYNIIII
jgi:hypothetical protein